MKESIAAMLRYKILVAPNIKQFAHTLASSFRTLLFLFAAGMFLFSCDEEEIKLSSETSLISLTLTVEGVNYPVKFTGKQGTFTVPYSTKLPGTATVTAVQLSDKATGVKVGENVTISASGTATLTVTAEDTKTKGVYTILMKKEDPSSETAITSLIFTVDAADYRVNFTDHQATLTLSYGTAIPTRVNVESVTLSSGATGVDAGDELTVTNNSVTITVTAEDGEATQAYTVTFVVSQATGSRFTSFTFATEGNEAMALEAEDRQEIVGTIDNETKTITFTQQSAYVYRNRLKAGFTTSDGATVQVGEEPQESGVTEQDFTLPVEYVVRAQDGTETTYTVTLLKSTLATIEDDPFRAKLQELIPDAFTGDQLNIMHDDVLNNNGVLRVNFQNPRITSLKGIEFFTALTYLDCHANALTTLDLSRNTALTTLDCSTNSLTVLDMSRNTALTTLDCSTNSLAALDMSRNTALTTLDCSFNSLTSLDMTGMRSVTGLAIGAGTGEDNPLLATLRVNTAVQDHAAIITMKTERGTDLIITTVNNEGEVVCDAYSPLASGGRCGSLSKDASITTLTLDAGGTDYPINFTDRAYTLTLPVDSTLPTIVSVESVILSTGATGVADDDELMVMEGGIVTITVTAEDGKTTQAYTVILVVSQVTGPRFTLFKFTPENNEMMALAAEDRKEIVGSIDHEANTITFARQSAYVYLNSLKASFMTSDGAAVQVGDTPQISGVTGHSFTSPIEYVVRVADGKQRTYTVTLTKSTTATIPDDNFRTKLSTLFPDAFTGDRLNIMHDDVINNNGGLTVNDQTPKITSLKGIEFFTSLTELYCGSNSLASLDVSKNTALTTLDCSSNSLPSLNVNENTALTDLYCDANRLASLNVSGNTALKNLSCKNNTLISLNVSGNTALKALYCNTNDLRSLNVGGNTALTTLDCRDNSLTSLDMTGMRSVIGLNIGTGTGEDNLLETLRVNTAIQDRTELITMKTARRAALTITTVDNTGMVVCADYNPAANGGRCGPLSTDASITTLTLTVAGTNYPINFINRAYALVLPRDVALPATVRVASVDVSPGATGVAMGNDFPVENDGIVTLEVTAEDGIAKETYTVTLVVFQGIPARFTSFKFTPEGNEAMALAEEDRQEIVGIIDNDVNTITFAQQSAYVYRNRLKATFMTSDGATVQVGETPQTSGVTEQDFTSPVNYVIRTQDGTTSTYTVTLTKSTMATIPDEDFRAILKTLFHWNAFTGDQLNIMHDEIINNNGELDVSLRNGLILSLKGIEFFPNLTSLSCFSYALTSLDLRKNTALTGLVCKANRLTSLDMTSMRSITRLEIGTGVIGDNPLETLRVNTAVQNHAALITMKTARGAALAITTVDNTGMEVCDDYTPIAGGGRCGPPRTDASITALTLTVAGTNYPINFINGAYTLQVGSTLPAMVSVASVQLSDGATGVAMGNDFPVGNGGIVTLEVTAEDGIAKETYTVTLVVSQRVVPRFTSFIFTTEDNEAMALEAEDRQEIVGIIDNDANTITFAQQSAYVYLNRLKAAFTTSDGVTVQVGDMPQTSGVTEQDFTSPVSYVVRDQDGAETTYTVTLAKSTMATIPDDQFRKELQRFASAAFTGDQLNITDNAVITNINLNNGIFDVSGQTPKITSLKGIEFFTAVEQLNCFGNSITSLDLRKNTALTTLLCHTNSLTSLDVSANTVLTTLQCQINSLPSLDVSKNTVLTTLACSNNSFISLDVSANTALTTLYCQDNRLISLDITGMRSVATVTALDIGTGTGGDNPLRTLRVNAAIGDHAAIRTMKGIRGTNLTITTVDDAGEEQCANYAPAIGGGKCNQAP